MSPDDAVALHGTALSQDSDVDGKRTLRWYPDLSGLRSLATYDSVVAKARLAYTQTNAYTQSSSVKPAHATTASCTRPCQPTYPYQQVPIDADGILEHCDTGLAGVAVSMLHSLTNR